MVKRPIRRGNGAARRDPDEQRRREQKALLKRALKDEQAIVALGRKVQRQTYAAEASMRQLHEWLGVRLHVRMPALEREQS
jgi:hypothetical protein